jgi:hypothetical protein
MTVNGLKFQYAEVSREIEALRFLARPLLDQHGDNILTTMGRELAATRELGRPAVWSSPDYLPPLRTRPTRNYHKADAHKGTEVVGQVEFNWEIEPDGDAFAVCGNTSIRIRILDAASGSELAMWRLEMGIEGAPGCFFHAQILGESEAPPFPSWLPVPRLPMHILTPPAAVEYLLAEVFQGSWPAAIASNPGRTSHFASIQLHRWERWLIWQQGVLRQDTATTPWAAIKAATPPSDLLAGRGADSTRRSGRRGH